GGGLSVKAEAAQANVSARPRSRRILGGSDLAIRLASVLVVLGTWEFLGPSLNPGILKPPSAILAAFPVLIQNGELQLALGQGVRNVDPGLLEVARAFSSSERRLWKDVVVPSALPFILAGVRLAIGRGLIGMIVAEFLIGLAGLGYLIIVYQNTFRIDRMFVPVIVVAALGIALMGLVQLIEGRVAPWLRR